MKPTSVNTITRRAAPLRENFSVFATGPWISSRCPASLVRFASARSRTPAVMLLNATRGLSFLVRWLTKRSQPKYSNTRKEIRMSNQQQPQPTLYERLGGSFSIATVVDELIDRVMTDARLNANPAVDEAHHKVSPAGFKYHVTEMVCWAAGGPQKYTGRSMRDSHQHLNITPKEWDAFMDDLQQTLDKFKVPAAEQAELRAIVQSTYGDIVIGKP